MKLPYLTIARGRDGTERAYVRRGHEAAIRVKGEIGTPEFIENYKAALAKINSEEWASLTWKEHRRLRDDEKADREAQMAGRRQAENESGSP
jgi:hypothetical protein